MPHGGALIAQRQKPSRIDLPDEVLIVLRQIPQQLVVHVQQFVPSVTAHHAVHRQAVDALKGEHRIAGRFIESAGNGDVRQLRQEVSQKCQIVLYAADGHALVAKAQYFRENGLYLGERQSLAGQLGQLLDARPYLLDLVPCGLAHDAVGVQVEHPLKLPHRILRVPVEYVGHRRDDGDAGIVFVDAIELLLNGTHALAVGAPLQRPSRIGGNVVTDRSVKDDVDVVAVVVLQDLIGDVALLRQIHAAPLAQPAALGAHSVAERGEQRLHIALPHDVVVENIVHDLTDVLKYIAAGDIGLIPLRGAGDVKVIAPAAVILRVDPVEGEGDLGHDIGPQRRLRPGRVQLMGGYVLDIAGEGNGHIGGVAVRHPQMDGDGGGNHRKCRHDGPPYMVTGVRVTGRMVLVLMNTPAGRSVTLS